MDWLYFILLPVAIVLTLTVIIWRYGAKIMALPCPAWLIVLLENPYMNSVSGSSLLISRAKVERGMAVLDVGCGPGRISIPAAEIVGSSGYVTALDIQPGMLKKLEKRIRENRLENIRLIHAGAGNAGLEANTFDRALMVTVLGEIQDRIGALREVYAALKPGGILSITEVLPDPHYQRKRVVRGLAEEAGFKLDEVYTGFLSFTMNFVKEAGRNKVCVQ